MTYLRPFCCFVILFAQCLFAKERTGNVPSREEYKEIEKRLNDADDRLGKLLTRLSSRESSKKRDVVTAKKEHAKNKTSSSPLEKTSIEKRLRDADDRLGKLLARLNSRESIAKKRTAAAGINVDTKNKTTPPPLWKSSNQTVPEVEKTKSETDDLQKKMVPSQIEPASDTLSLDSNQSFAPKGWNLFVLRELALKHSTDILLKKSELQISKKGIPIIQFGRLPTLKAKVSFDDYRKVSQFETYSEPNAYNTFSYGLDSRWVLYDGHKNRKEVNVAKNEINQAQWTLYTEEQKVLKNLTNLFFSAVSTQTQLNFLPKIEAIAKKKLVVSKKKLESGIVDRILFRDSLRDLESIQAQILNSAHSLQVAKAEIGFLLNADPSFWNNNRDFIVPEDFEFEHDFDPDHSSSASLGQAGIEIAQSKYDEIQTGFSPVVELIGSAGHRSKNKVSFEKQGQELTLGLSLSLPITDRYLTRRKLEQAREEIRKSELEKVRLVTAQTNSFSSENLRLSQAARSLDFQNEMLDLQKKRLADIRSTWPLGIYDQSDVLMEEEKLLKREMYVELTRLNLIKQKYQLDLIE
jgi:outer membrane protein